MSASGPFTLVLSGGGLKGLAHIGVLRALEERALTPTLVVGTSIGALIGAAWAAGTSVAEMEQRARAVRRRDIFRVAHTDMAFRRMRSPALYRSEPLDALIRSLVGDVTFDQLSRRLLVNTADLNSGQQVLWGLPGFRQVQVAETVAASCALPGIFAPRRIGGRAYVDGAVVDNLPVRQAAAVGKGSLVAVNVATSGAARARVETLGFASVYTRGLEIVMHRQIDAQLRNWDGPPLILVSPDLGNVSLFAFDRTEELLEAGYQATMAALDTPGNSIGSVEPAA